MAGNVASRITYIFERLLALDRVVVLFDEIEEFALDRSNPALTMESRLLTTAMLTKVHLHMPHVTTRTHAPSRRYVTVRYG